MAFTAAPALAVDVASVTDLKNVASKGGTATLTADITIDDPGMYAAGLTIQKTMILDLNGKTLTIHVSSWNTNGISINAGNTLTIQDSVGGGTLLVNNTVNIAVVPGYGAAINTSGATLNIDSGTVTANGGFSAAGIGGGYENAGGTVNISGGTVNATAGDGANLTIHGGITNITGGSAGFGAIGGGKGGTINGASGTTIIDSGSLFVPASKTGNATITNPMSVPVFPATITALNASNSGIANATIHIGAYSAITDGSGKACLYLPAGSYTEATASLAGYKTTPVPTFDVATAATSQSVTMNLVLSISTNSLPSGTENTPYSQNIAISGGTSPFAYSVSNGSLPTGLTISPSGLISGTPTQNGTFAITVTVTDTLAITATKSFNLTIDPDNSLKVIKAALAPGAAGTPYNDTIAMSGGTPPYTFALTSAANTLPAGLTLSTSGNLSGTPTTAGTYSPTIEITDNASSSVSQTFTMTIGAAGALIITKDNLAIGTAGTSYADAVTAAGGVLPYTFSLDSTSPPLPSGMTLAGNGAISGTPTDNGSTTIIVVKVTDSAGTPVSITHSYTLQINAINFSITMGDFPTAVLNEAYTNAAIPVTGGTPPYTFAVIGTLPAGLTMSLADGSITGTPTGSGMNSFVVQVTDATGVQYSHAFNLPVSPSTLDFSAAPLAEGTKDAPYNRFIMVRGGMPPYNYEVSSGALPTGLALHPATGEISGIPTGTGTFPFSVKITDSYHLTATNNYTMTINNASTGGNGGKGNGGSGGNGTGNGNSNGTGNNGNPSPSPVSPVSPNSSSNISYKLLAGSDAVFSGGSTGLTFRVDAPFGEFKGASVNGKEIMQGSDYQIREGSLILTLNSSFLNTLDTGEHYIDMMFTNGSARSYFKVTASGFVLPLMVFPLAPEEMRAPIIHSDFVDEASCEITIRH